MTEKTLIHYKIIKFIRSKESEPFNLSSIDTLFLGLFLITST